MRRYRGRDSVAWLAGLSFFDRTPDMLESLARRFGAGVHLSGGRSGRTISLHRLHRDGVELLGRPTVVDGEKMPFADDLQHNLENADRFSRTFQDNVVAFVAKNGFDVTLPTAEELDGEPPDDGWSLPHRHSIHILEEKFTTVVWATGFSCDFTWVKFPVCDEMGCPVTDCGANSVPGLYFMGLNWR